MKIFGVHLAFAVAVFLQFLPIGIGAAEDNRAPGTIRMAERLEQVAKTVNPLNVRFFAAQQVEIYRQMFAEKPELSRDPAMRFQLADSLLNAGRNLEALAEFESIERLVAESGQPLAGVNKLNVRLNEALCHLREAERVNCLTNHNADSCLLPLRGGGIHKWADPSRRSIGVLTNVLGEFPDSLAARWLLNVACMTVGDYPCLLYTSPSPRDS